MIPHAWRAVALLVAIVVLTGYAASRLEPRPHVDEEVVDAVAEAFNDKAGRHCFRARDMTHRDWSSATVLPAGTSRRDAEERFPRGTRELDELPREGAGDEVMLVFEDGREVSMVALVERTDVELNGLASASSGALRPQTALRVEREAAGARRLVVKRAAGPDCPAPAG